MAAASPLLLADLRHRIDMRSNSGAEPEWEAPHVHRNCPKDPRRYFEEIGAGRSSVAEQPPICLYLEVTNRCNLLCETCPRTFEDSSRQPI